jgi:hypothetical protein
VYTHATAPVREIVRVEIVREIVVQPAPSWWKRFKQWLFS